MLSVKNSNLRWLFLSIIIIIADQLSKYFSVHYLQYGNPVSLLPFFNLTLSFNPGAAFGFLGTQGGWQIYLLSLISALVTIALVIWLWRLHRRDNWTAAAISLIIGGAIGNLIDRVRLSFVIDFFDFHIGDWHYDTFNLADSAVCVGAFLLIVLMLWGERK